MIWRAIKIVATTALIVAFAGGCAERSTLASSLRPAFQGRGLDTKARPGWEYAVQLSQPEDSNLYLTHFRSAPNGEAEVAITATSGVDATLNRGTLKDKFDKVEKAATHDHSFLFCASKGSELSNAYAPTYDADRNEWTLFVRCVA